MKVRALFAVASLLASTVAATPCFAWGDHGHMIVAAIARARLSASTRAKVDAILAKDADILTGKDMLARATWADQWRDHGHRETASWHFVDIELVNPDFDAACFGHPASFQLASAGPPNNCVVDKIKALSAELAAKNTPPSERLLALKFLLHFVGDLHQPLHASDNQDRGGNCVMVNSSEEGKVKLHHYWDTTVVDALGPTPEVIANQLGAAITADEAEEWKGGDVAQWTHESYAVAVQTAYTLGNTPQCPKPPNTTPPSTIALPDSYDAAAKVAVALQLKRAGVRLARVLEDDLASLSLIEVTGAVEGNHLSPAPRAVAHKKRRRRIVRR